MARQRQLPGRSCDPIKGVTAHEAAFLQQAVSVFRGAGYETLDGPS